MWVSPLIQVKWGPYFKPDPADQKVVIDLAVAAINGGLITKRIAVEKIASIFDIENVDAVLESLEEEAQETHDSDLEKQVETQKEMSKVTPSSPVKPIKTL